ncbi:MAG: hypothetical protein RIQ81_1684 [Pseudomonadota bacterium]|jgi:NAD(P)H-dependent FMN reductase
MKIAVISGSHRANSQSRKVADFICKQLGEMSGFAEPWLFDLATEKLPLWDEGVWSGEERWKKIWQPVSQNLKACDGLVVIAPEYAGMVPAALKNFFLLTGNAEVGHKPALIVTVSAGMGGAYPNMELRASSYKNNRILYIPDHVVIRNVEHLMNVAHDGDITPEDQYIRGRLAYSLGVLNEYAKALKVVRESGIIDFKTYPNGM